MQVGHLVAKGLIIQFTRLECRADRPRQLTHFIQISSSFHLRKIIQFDGVGASHEDTVARVILPGAKQGHGMRELPDYILVRQLT